MRSPALLTVCLMLSFPEAGSGQWLVGAGLAQEVFQGVSAGQEEGEPSVFRPAPSRIWSVRVETPGRRLRWALEVRYARPLVTYQSGEVEITLQEHLTTATGIHPAAIYPIVHLTDQVVLNLEGGPLLEFWSSRGEDRITAVSGLAGMWLRVGLGGRLAGRLGATLSYSPTAVIDVTSIEGWESRPTWRRGLSGSLLIRL
ncbi:MAG: hypothetical protein AAB075_01530 [Gemmatimonadota bacterium]